MRTLPPTLYVCLLASCLFATVSVKGATAEEANEIRRLHQAGSSAQALVVADKLLLARPKDAQLRFLRGVVLAEMQRGAEAIGVFQTLTEDFPELAEPYNNLAALYAAHGDYEKARAALEQAVRSNPDYATAHENLGDVYAMLASRSYGRALTLEPANHAVTTKLGLVRELFGTRLGAAKSPPAQ
jgi:tetratricopeptide (TPR) repeat protein